MYHDDEFIGALDSVYVEVTTGDSVAGPWTTLAGYQRPRATPGWKQEILSLLQYNGATRVFIGFRGVSDFGNNIYVDEVRLADSSFHDIRWSQHHFPSRIHPDSPGGEQNSLTIQTGKIHHRLCCQPRPHSISVPWCRTMGPSLRLRIKFDGVSMGKSSPW
jgi:hypothetical protein